MAGSGLDVRGSDAATFLAVDDSALVRRCVWGDVVGFGVRLGLERR